MAARAPSWARSRASDARGVVAYVAEAVTCRNLRGPGPGRVTILIVDDTSAQPSPIGTRRMVVRCLSSFVALLVVFFLVPQGILDGQPEWLAVVITSLLVLGAFQLVELVDNAVHWLRTHR